MQRLLAGRLARFLAACALMRIGVGSRRRRHSRSAGVGPTYEVGRARPAADDCRRRVVEAVRQATWAPRSPDAITELAVQGRRPRPRRPGAGRASTRAPPSRRWRPAGRRSPRPRRISPTPGGGTTATSTCSRRSSSARPRSTSPMPSSRPRRLRSTRSRPTRCRRAPRRRSTTITAPFAGVVGATHVELGDMAQPGRQLVTVFDPEGSARDGDAAAGALAKAKLDAPVAIELPGARRDGAGDAGDRDPARRRADAHRPGFASTCPATDGVLPGQFARACFVTGTTRALAVPPASALLKRGEVTAVYVVDRDGRACCARCAPASRVAGGMVEILAGLAGGERIAQNPVQAGMAASAAAVPAAK